MAVIILGLETIIGTGGGSSNSSNSDDGDNNDTIEEKVNNPIIGQCYCKNKTSPTTQGSTYNDVSYPDIEYLPGGTLTPQ